MTKDRDLQYKWTLATFIISFLFLFLSYLPILYEASLVDKLPQNRIMIPGEHIYPYDYNVYLSKIRQGSEGRNNVVDRYDNHSENHGVFLQMFYLVSGKLGALFNLEPSLIYEIVRVLTSVLWVLTIIYINTYFLKKPKKVFLGVALALLSSSFPTFYRFENQTWVGSYMNWWQELDVVKRISFIPHDTINYIVVAFCTILLIRLNSGLIWFYTLCIILSTSILIQPTAAILIFVSWMLYHFFSLIWDKPADKIRNLKSFVIKTAILTPFVLLPLLYIKSVTSVYPWKSLLDYDSDNRLVLPIKEYLLALGPIVISGIVGGIIVIFKRDRFFLPLVTWILGVAVAIFIFRYFPSQSELRFVQTANHIPLAILSVYLLISIVNEVRYHVFRLRGLRQLADSQGLPASGGSRKNGYLHFVFYSLSIYIVLTLIVGLVQTYFSLKAQFHFIRQRAVAVLPLVPYPPQVMYPLTDFYNSLTWIKNNTPTESVILSKITAGNYIPAYSGRFVYLGHPSETPHFQSRTIIAGLFFSGGLDKKKALDFLKKENIDYVFYGPQEAEDQQKNIGEYQFLTPVYKSQYVTIYKVLR